MFIPGDARARRPDSGFRKDDALDWASFECTAAEA